jgi:hypothetical protein
MRPWHVLYEKLKPYVVKIETQDGFGTGFLFAYNTNKDIAAVATALHVIYHADHWRQPIRIIQESTGKEAFLNYDERVIWVDLKRDSSAIAIHSNKLEFPDETLPLLPADYYKKVGVDVGWVGYPALSPDELCFFQGRISAFKQSNDTYLIDGVAINGVSGGPIFGEDEGVTCPASL